jgi:hypothetical protein
MKRTRKKTEGDAPHPFWRGRRLRELAWLGLLLLALTGLTAIEFVPSPTFAIKPWKADEVLAYLVILTILLTSVYYYSRIRVPALWQRLRWTLFTVGVIVAVALLNKALALFAAAYIPKLFYPVSYAVPAAVGAALVGLFFGAGAGFLTNIVIALLVSLGAPHAVGLATATPEFFVHFLVAFGAGLMAIFRVLRLSQLSDFVFCGLEIAGVNIAMYAAGTTLQGTPLDVWGLAWAGIGGPVTALLTLAAIPIAEWATQRTSSLGLVQLLNPSHPLLALLRERAPGTYHHSCNVADLGESAAQAIGADPLLTKVGGYFHDIGKIERPEFFMENQRDGVNPHDTLSPPLSKMILTAHIKRGLELGREHGLHEDLLQFISQHHGTSVIRYFYVKALQEPNKDCAVSMDDYRYDSQRPQTKETAIIMLADSVEAASRAVENGTRLEAMVEEALRDKLTDGQLAQAPITLADLEKIQLAFCQTLRAMKHLRSEAYPKLAAPKRPGWTRTV